MQSWFKSPDLRAILTLIILWVLFFGRVITPIRADQLSFKQGDFSGQFVAFGGYQYQRFAQGEIPLWNPYNNGGMPFIADTQSAVFYPLRWVTLAWAQANGGWSYHALQLEAIAHIGLFSLFLYGFLRRLTRSVWGALVGAIIGAYGGFMSGYPPLQLALLEAGIWLPLVLWGIFEAIARPVRWHWLAFAGWALGLSWLAGHPQTSWFATLASLAWLGYRVWEQGLGWRTALMGVALLGAVTFGVTAVSFLPSAEYLQYTTRSDLGFEAKRNGFPFIDLIQFILPRVVSLFSPLYVGLPALVLAFIALRHHRQTWFWGGLTGIALLLSFGGNSVIYSLLYGVLPGLSFFRGQERAAYLVMMGYVVLASYGMAFITSRTWQPTLNFQRGLWLCVAILGVITAFTLVLWLGNPAYATLISVLPLSLGVLAGVAWLFNSRWIAHNGWQIAFVSLLVFELFSVNMGAPSNYAPVPHDAVIPTTPPPLIEYIQQDANEGQPFRVDGFRGLRDNYGSLYGVMDIRGISPLFLTSAEKIIYQHYISNPVAWELFAVKYILSERDSLSAVPTTVIATGADRDGTVYLHQVTNPRPFAHLVYRYDRTDSDAFARALLDDPNYRPRESIILQQDPSLDLPDTAPIDASSRVISFAPEHIVIQVNTPENAILSLAQVHYVGWNATLNGSPVPILRAYGGLSAIAIPAGDHTIELTYTPLSFRIGAIFSLFTWGLLAILALWTGWYHLRHRHQPT